jgi:glycosyltransferase involved in cell wall biosynthesis
MVTQMNLSDSIHFLGKIQRNMLSSYYKEADLLCVPSLSDSLPTVVLEAFISGTPVVGSHVGGIPFMVRNGRTGWLVRHEDPNALAQVLEDITKSPNLLPILGEAAFREANERFSWKNIGLHLSEIIQNHCSSH